MQQQSERDPADVGFRVRGVAAGRGKHPYLSARVSPARTYHAGGNAYIKNSIMYVLEQLRLPPN